MTAINSYVDAGAVIVMADTVMTTHDGRPVAFVSKIFPVPHLSAVVSGRGTIGLIAGWAYDLCHAMLVDDFDMAVQLAPDALAAKWADLEGQRTDTSTVYMWGWSAAAVRFIGYQFRSWNAFAAEIIGDGTNYAPGLADSALMGEINADPDRFNAMLRMMIAAKEENDALPQDDPDRCYIGGEVVVVTLSLNESDTIVTSSFVFHRFPDRDAQYLQAAQLLDTEG